LTTRARILAQTLNRTRGEDDPEKKARLLEQALETLTVEEALRYLPETKKSLDELLIQYAPSRHAEDADAVLPVPEDPESELGEVYELGPHRLMCGDATNPEHVETLLGGGSPVLLATDPPYGVELDMEWRDRARFTSASAPATRVRKNPRWRVSMPGSHPGRHTRRQPHVDRPHPFATSSTRRVAVIFAGACGVTLGAGVALEVAGNTLADRAGVNGVIFGATVLATATALPEISSGIAAVRLGDNALAIGDIFGGNAFQVCLFLVADLIAGTPVLPTAGRLNGWLASLGVALTAIYAIGIVGRPERCRARLGPDSILALIVFGLGIAGLFVLPP